MLAPGHRSSYFVRERLPLPVFLRCGHALLLIGLFTLLVPAHGVAATQRFAAKNNYGALAFNPASGAHGYSYDQRSRRAALDAARAQCGIGCSQTLQFKDSCGAIAASSERPPARFALAGGDARDLAESRALAKCKDRGCAIVAWVCTR
jgi:hypothetical protein